MSSDGWYKYCDFTQAQNDEKQVCPFMFKDEKGEWHCKINKYQNAIKNFECCPAAYWRWQI
jgi:hypothetical protein